MIAEIVNLDSYVAALEFAVKTTPMMSGNAVNVELIEGIESKGIYITNVLNDECIHIRLE